jgi:hypothetical protein
VSQFFDTNPGDRSPQGPKRGGWPKRVPSTWRTALGLPELDPQDAAGEAAADEGSTDGAAPHLGEAGGEEPRI